MLLHVVGHYLFALKNNCWQKGINFNREHLWLIEYKFWKYKMYTKYCMIYFLKKISEGVQNIYQIQELFWEQKQEKNNSHKAKNYLISPDPSLTLNGLKYLMIYIKDFQLKMKDWTQMFASLLFWNPTEL